MTQNSLNLDYPEALRLKERIAKAKRRGNFGAIKAAERGLLRERTDELRRELFPRRKRKGRGRTA